MFGISGPTSMIFNGILAAKWHQDKHTQRRVTMTQIHAKSRILPRVLMRQT